ncbi:PEGA domain-containing protein [Nitrosomonas marina]|uniref:PEGA domain-containing protein n=1 Tax=Nitrosomonas marina TaxID=917 RepID=A0A1H9Y241_9PROT|nr:PEGA domain-containing protein [Nitrosomonas marina]SES62851.1 PEGA domain-containing protein [Nitrosomonas marina]
MKKSILVAFTISFMLSGCATMFNGSTQQVAIRSNQPDAELYVNEAFVGKGNTVTTFKKKEDYMITVRKEGCNSVTVPATKSFDATTLLGVFIDFGLITILAIDGAGTGAWNKFDQTSFVVDPQCPQPSAWLMPYNPAIKSMSWILPYDTI